MIEKNGFGYNEPEREQNWAWEKARREIEKHREAKIIDHPDGSVTESKLADGAVTLEKLNESVMKEVDKKISDEAEVREADDMALQQNIDSESSARQSADNTLQKNINSEASERRSADTELGNRIGSETSERQSADNTLQKNINSEASERRSADTALGNRIDAEASARQSADTALGNRIDSESAARSSADAALQQKINSEASSRSSADSALDKKIADAAAESKNADNTLSERIAAVEDKAHTHINAKVLDNISEEDIKHWNGILEQVTQAQLDAVKVYLEEICFGLTNIVRELWNAVGVTVYDGGYFNQAQDDIVLDGGLFSDTELESFDCGGFEPITVSAAVIDGGSY